VSVQDRYRAYVSDQRRHFDELVTEDWETYLQREVTELWRFEVGLLLRWVRPATILDLGCGCGFHDAEMARPSFVQRIDAVDYSVKSIERAERSFAHPKVRYRVADFLGSELTGAYDLVVSFQVIEHLEAPVDFLRLCGRRCRPGGRVALFTVNPTIARACATASRRSWRTRCTNGNSRRRNWATWRARRGWPPGRFSPMPSAGPGDGIGWDCGRGI
jgi:2-polyprenyl-3-methyl-5-hydroxy-6-metoxy-1,4-benzoquinol methylase